MLARFLLQKKSAIISFQNTMHRSINESYGTTIHSGELYECRKNPTEIRQSSNSREYLCSNVFIIAILSRSNVSRISTDSVVH